MADLPSARPIGSPLPPRLLDAMEDAPWDERRVERQLLSLRNRRRIVDHVAEHPGIHLRKVARDLRLALGTAEHHLHLLVRHGLLEVGQAQGQSCYFAPGTPPEDRLLWVVMRQDAQRRLLRVLATDPDLGTADLGRRLGLSKAAVAHHLQRLEAWGFVDRLRIGRQRLLRVTRPDRLAEVLAALDDERPAIPWPGLLMTLTPTTRVRPASKDRTPAAEGTSARALVVERSDARIRSSSA